MSVFSRLRDGRFCAYCRSPRQVYVKKHVGLTNVLGAVALTITATYAYFGIPDPRGVVLFCLIMILSEIFVYTRWRASVVCRMCGFDPVVYKRSPSEAAALVRKFFESQANNPKFLLSKSPLVELYRKQAESKRRRRRSIDRVGGPPASPDQRDASPLAGVEPL